MARDNPFAEIERLFERMSRQVEDASRRWSTERDLAGRSAETSMAVDLVDDGDEFVVSADLPGYDRDDVDVGVTDRALRIEAERSESTDEEGEQFIHHERRHTSTRRSLRLPEAVATDGVTARMHNGVLTVTLPKLAAADATEVEIE